MRVWFELSSRERVWLVIATLGLIAHSLVYNFVTDDAYISFVFSRNLAEHGQLAFNVGDPVEGYTNFLWTITLGLFMKLGLGPELMSRVLGTVFGVGTLWVVSRTMTRLLPRGPRVVPAVLLAASSGFACWSSGGLETQMFSFWLALGVDAYLRIGAAGESQASTQSWRDGALIGLWLGLSAITRPEGLLVTALVGLHWLLLNGFDRRWLPSRTQWVALIALLAFIVPFFLWRHATYGYWLPNTYYVKAHGPWQPATLAREMWSNGLYYVWVWIRQTGVWLALPIALLASWPAPSAPSTPSATASRRRRAASLLWLLVLGYLGYVVSVGGDFMGLHRFIVPVFVWTAMLLALGLDAGSRRWAGTAFVGVGLVLAFFVSQVLLTQRSVRWGNFAADRGIDTPAYLMAYTEDRARIGAVMAPCFAPDDFSIVGGAGAQPYFGRMRAIDVFGLVSSRIAHEEPRIRARAGHTKFGSDKLLAETDPTFVFSCYDIRRTDDPAPLPCGGFWRTRGYEQVTMHIPGLRERGEYYVFLAKKSRAFACPGRVR